MSYIGNKTIGCDYIPKEMICTRIEKKLKEMFEAECEKSKKTPYSVLQELIKKFANKLINVSPSEKRLLLMQKEIEELKRKLRIELDSKDSEIEELKSIAGKYSIDNPDTWKLFKKIATYAFNMTMKRNQAPLDDKALELLIEIIEDKHL